MRSLKILSSAAALVALAACSSLPGGSPGADLQSSLNQLGQFTLTDVQNADKIAVANSDTLAHECFASGQGLQKFIADQQTLVGSANGMTVSGAISAFEAGRVTVKNGQAMLAAGVPQYLLQDCGPLVAAVRLDAASFLAQLAAFGIKP